MKIIVVDNKDKVISYKHRNDRNTTDIIRVSGLWLINSQQEVLIAQRALNKIHDPGKWGPSAAGTVEKGETYTINIIKEAREELGIVLDQYKLVVGTPQLIDTTYKYYLLLHFAKIDLPVSGFIIQKEEVKQIRWISVTELSEIFNSNPENFTGSFKKSLKELRAFVTSNQEF